MREQIIKISAFVLLGIVIGWLLSSALNRESPIIRHISVSDTTYVESSPDTFWVHEPVPKIVTKTIYTDTGSTKIEYVVQDENSPGLIWSYEKFNHSEYVTSEVTALSPDSVDLFQNKVIVEWQSHYNDNYRPQMEIKLKKEKDTSLIKGLAAGALVTAGVASGKWEYAVGGAVAAFGVVIFF